MDTSLELEDFDPLNQNAKKIPNIPPRLTPTFQTPTVGIPIQSTNSLPVQSYSNPVYNIHMPPMLPPQPSIRHTIAKHDDDVEWLRKYGLDRFHLNDVNGTKTNEIAQHTRNTKNDPFCSPVNGNGGANYVNGYSNGNGLQKLCNDQWTKFE